MSASSKKPTIIQNNETASNSTPSSANEFEADVLFQRIYDKWYAFTVVDEDCLVTEVSADEVQKRQALSKKFMRAA